MPPKKIKIIKKKTIKKKAVKKKFQYDSENSLSLEYLPQKYHPLYPIILRKSKEEELFLCGGSLSTLQVMAPELTESLFDQFKTLLLNPRQISIEELTPYTSILSQFGPEKKWSKLFMLAKSKPRHWLDIKIYSDDTISNIYKKIQAFLEIPISEQYLWTVSNRSFRSEEIQAIFYQSSKGSETTLLSDFKKTLSKYCHSSVIEQLTISKSLSKYISLSDLSLDTLTNTDYPSHYQRLGGFQNTINEGPLIYSVDPFDQSEIDYPELQFKTEHDYLLSDYLDKTINTIYLVSSRDVPEYHHEIYFPFLQEKFPLNISEERKILQKLDQDTTTLWKYSKNIEGLDLQFSLIQSILSTSLLTSQNIYLESLFDEISLNSSIPFVKYRNEQYQEYQYKVYRHIAYDPDLKKSLVPLDTFQKWRGDVIRQENSIHKSKGLSLRFKQSSDTSDKKITGDDEDDRYSIVNFYVNGRVEIRSSWKEYNQASFKDLKNTIIDFHDFWRKNITTHKLISPEIKNISIPRNLLQISLVNFIIRAKLQNSILFSKIVELAMFYTQYWVLIEQQPLFLHFKYRKTSCFDENASIDHVISTLFLKKKEEEEISKHIQKQFKLNEVDAKKRIGDWKDSQNLERDDYRYKKSSPGIDIRINYGGQIKQKQLDSGELFVRVEGVTNINQLQDISRFLQSFFNLCDHHTEVRLGEKIDVEKADRLFQVFKKKKTNIVVARKKYSSSDSSSDSNSGSSDNSSESGSSDKTGQDLTQDDKIVKDLEIKEKTPDYYSKKEEDEKANLDEYVINRLKQHDRELFDYKKDPTNSNITPYTSHCQKAQERQPIVINQEEKDRIDRLQPGSYHTLNYIDSKRVYDYVRAWYQTKEKLITELGKFPSKAKFDSWDHKTKSISMFEKELGLNGVEYRNNYYICPTYWCIRCQTSLIDTNMDPKNPVCPLCGGIKIGKDRKTEQGSNNTLVVRDNSYWKSKPGFIGFADPNLHPKKLCTPCCGIALSKGQGPNNSYGYRNAKICFNREELQEQTTTNYVKSRDKVPLDTERLGLLPENLDKFFSQTLDNVFSGKEKSGSILTQVQAKKKGLPYFQSFYTRIGCDQSQPFLYAITSLIISPYLPNPKIDDPIRMIKERLTFARFAHVQKGQLVSVFCPYDSTQLVNSLDVKTQLRYQFLRELSLLTGEEQRLFQLSAVPSDTNTGTLNRYYQKHVQNNLSLKKLLYLYRIFLARRSFIAYLEDDNHKDPTYLWDLVSLEGVILAQGLNLYIFEHITDTTGKSNQLKLVCHPQNEFGHRQNRATVYMCKQGMYYEPIVLLLSREQVVQELQNPEDTPLKRELVSQYYQVSDLPMIIKLRYFSYYQPVNQAKLISTVTDNNQIYNHPKYNINSTRINLLDLLKELSKISTSDHKIEIQSQYINSLFQVILLGIKINSYFIWLPVEPSALLLPSDLSNFIDLTYQNPVSLEIDEKNLYCTSLEDTVKASLLLTKNRKAPLLTQLYFPSTTIVCYKTLEDEINGIMLNNDKNNVIPIKPEKIKSHVIISGIRYKIDILDSIYYSYDDSQIYLNSQKTDDRITFMNREHFSWESYQRLRLELSRLLNTSFNKSVLTRKKAAVVVQNKYRGITNNIKKDKLKLLQNLRIQINEITGSSLSVPDKRKLMINALKKVVSIFTVGVDTIDPPVDYHLVKSSIRQSCQTKKKDPHCSRGKLILPREKKEIFIMLLADELVRNDRLKAEILQGIPPTRIVSQNTSGEIHRILSMDEKVVTCSQHNIEYTDLWYDKSNYSTILESKNNARQPDMSDYHQFPYNLSKKNINYFYLPQKWRKGLTPLTHPYVYIYHQKNNYYALQQALLHLYPDQNYTKANLQKIIISQTKNIAIQKKLTSFYQVDTRKLNTTLIQLDLDLILLEVLVDYFKTLPLGFDVILLSTSFKKQWLRMGNMGKDTPTIVFYWHDEKLYQVVLPPQMIFNTLPFDLERFTKNNLIRIKPQ